MRKITIMLVFLLIAGVNFAFAQSRTITGKVTSAQDGMGIPGVTVMVKGTTIGTTTDIDGNYSIDVRPDHKTLIFRYVGMNTQEINVGSQTAINIVMQPDVLQMDEVVVTAIGISREQKALGYAVQTVSEDDIARSANTNLISALGGRASSVEVTSSSGAAGGAQYITIRGAGTITGNNQPLFVVDGIPINNDVTLDDEGFRSDDVGGVARGNRALDLNPDDIESMSVLKGGAATALYGLRGANGVIVITTKKGTATKGRKINVNFSSSVTWSQITQVPELTEKYAQGRGGQWGSGDMYSWGPRLDTMGYSQDPSVWTNPDMDLPGALVSVNSPFYNPALGKAKSFNQYDFFETGMMVNNSLNVSGGNDVSNFYISLSDMSDKGVVPNNEVRRNTFRINGETKINDKVTISGGANYIVYGGSRIQQGSNVSGVMLGLLRTPTSFDNAAGYELVDGSQRSYRGGGGYDNPYWTANKNLYRDRTNRFIGNVQANWIATDWLSITYRAGVDWYSEQVKNHLAVGSRANPVGYVFARNYVARDINSDLLANMQRDFSEDITGTLTLGWNLQENYFNFVRGTANGLSVPNYYNLNNSASVLTGEGTTKIRRAGIFFDAGASYKSMIFLNVTGRNDWSTTLPEGNNSFFYPSVSGGFIFTELPALKDNDILPYGKVRASWAKTAIDAPAYQTATTFTQAGPTDGWVQPNGIIFPISVGEVDYNAFTYNDVIGNSELKPEITTTTEIGLELKFLKNRLGLDVAYFNNQSKDLLLPVDIDPATGFASMFINAAEMESKGFEFTLYTTPIQTKDFTWNLDVNFSAFKNTVLALADNVDALFLGGFVDPQIRAVAGEEYRTIYGYDWLRDDNGNVLINDDPNSTWYGYPEGDYNMQVLGKVNPDWTMGINTAFMYKNITLSALFDFRQGNQMWNGTRGALYFFGTHADLDNRDATDYVFEGVKSDGSPNDIQVQLGQDWYTSGEGSGFTGPTVPFIEDADWVRLKDLTLAYTFNQSLLNKTFIKKLDVYFTAKNLWLSTPYTGIDPETSLLSGSNAQGMDYFNMPGTKSYTLGLRLSL